MASHLKLIIFDLDGTLIDAYPAITSSFNYTMRAVGMPQQPAEVIRRAVGRGDRNLLAPYVKAAAVDRALRVYRRHHAGALRAHTRLYPSVKSLLAGLKKRGIILAVASNRPTKFSLIVLRHLGIRRYFDAVLCKDAVRFGKPHPLMLNMLMRRFKAGPRDTMYVGDMAIDGEAGRRAHVKTVMVTTGSSTRGELGKYRPFAIVGRVKDIIGVIDKA